MQAELNPAGMEHASMDSTTCTCTASLLLQVQS
jgi:hypothetical protein